MEHIGIDLGSKESQVCVRSADGEIVGEWPWRADRLVGFLQDRPAARVIVETCTEAFRIAALAQHLRIPRSPDQNTDAANWTRSRIRAGAPGP